MSDKKSLDSIIGEQLQQPPDQIKRARMAWNEDTIMHAVFAHRFKAKIEELRNTLETGPIENCDSVRAEIRAHRLALNIVTAKEI